MALFTPPKLSKRFQMSYKENEVAEYMTSLEIKVNIQIFSDNKEFEVYTMDLTKKFIEINADYRS